MLESDVCNTLKHDIERLLWNWLASNADVFVGHSLPLHWLPQSGCPVWLFASNTCDVFFSVISKPKWHINTSEYSHNGTCIASGYLDATVWILVGIASTPTALALTPSRTLQTAEFKFHLPHEMPRVGELYKTLCPRLTGCIQHLHHLRIWWQDRSNLGCSVSLGEFGKIFAGIVCVSFIQSHDQKWWWFIDRRVAILIAK